MSRSNGSSYNKLWMAGNKRSWEGNIVSADATATMTGAAPEASDASPIQSVFTHFRSELDQHHDRRERVIKASRDITALSKKIIFALQRVRAINKPIPKNIAKENQERLSQISSLFSSVAPDLAGINGYRYQWQISPGIQEYIEAITFQRYVETQELMSHQEVTATLPAEVVVTEADYASGLFDLTGEMMRFAITAMTTARTPRSRADQGSSAESERGEASELTSASPGDAIVGDLRAMRAQFETLNVPRGHSLLRDLNKKMEVMQSSVEKVERAKYGLLVRGSERPGGWVPDLANPMEVESY